MVATQECPPRASNRQARSGHRLRPFANAAAVGALLLGCGDAVDPDGTGELAVEFSVAQGAAGAPLDEVTVELSGAASQTVTLTQSGGFFEATVNELPVGTYTLLALGTAAGEVTYFGRLSGVQVQADQTTNADVPFAEFVTAVSDILGGQTTSFTLPVNFSPVTNATQYVVEYDTDPNFASPTRTDAITGTDAQFSVSEVGTYHVRVRAANASVSVDQAAASEPVAVEVVADAVAGADQGTAAVVTPGAVTDLNVYPASEENWFAIDLQQDDLVFFAVRTSSLDLASPLNPFVRLLDAGGTEVGANDDEGPDNVESRLAGLVIPATGTYNVVVTSSGGGSVGHFELELVLLGDQLITLRTMLEDPFIEALISSVADTDPAIGDGFMQALNGVLDGDVELIETGIADARAGLEAASNPDDIETVGVLLLLADYAETLLPT